MLGGLSEAGFAEILLGFSGWRGPCWHRCARTSVCTRDGECLTRDHESLRVLGGLSEAGFAGFIWIFGMAGAMLAQVRSYERMDERWRAFTRDHESLRVLGGLSEAGFAGFIWIFGMAGAMLAQVRSYERMDERWRAFTRDHESLRVLGGLSEAGFAGFIGIFGMAGAMLAQVRSYKHMDERWRAFTRDHESLRVFTRDCGRSFERARWATGDIIVGLPARAGRRGYFYKFFHKYVRFVRSKAYRKFENELLQIQCPCFATVSARPWNRTMVGPRRAQSLATGLMLPGA